MRRAGGEFAALLLVASAGFASAQPANDDCANATVIGTLPFIAEVDVTDATIEAGEPTSDCGGYGNTIWYQLSAGPTDRLVYVDTWQSDAWANVGIYLGTCGALGPEVPDCGSAGQNAAFRIPANLTVFIQIGLGRDPAIYGSGPLRFTIDEMPDFAVTLDGDMNLPHGVAASPTGQFLTCWAGYAGGSGYAKLFDADGTPLTGDVLLDAADVEARAEGLATGDFVTAWNEAASIRARMLDSTGMPIGPSFEVHDQQGSIRIASDDAGDFAIAWNGFDNDVGIRLYDPTGTPKGGLITYTADTRERIDLGMAGNGDFAVSWFGNVTKGVFVQRFDSAGATIGAPFRADGADGWAVYEDIAMAMAPSGDFVVTWESYLPYGSYDSVLRVRAFDAGGNPRGDPVVVNETLHYTQHLPEADADGTGNFVVVWENDGSRYNGLSDSIDMSGRRIGRTGMPLGPEFLVNHPNVNTQYEPNVAAAPSGEFMVVWNSYLARAPWGPDAHTIAARIFAADEELYPGCASAPMVGCKQPTVAGASSILVRDQEDDRKDQLKWKLTKGAATTSAEFGDPSTTDRLTVCLYDAAPSLVYEGRVLPGGTCGTKPCWKALGAPPGAKGFKYKNKDGTPNGIQKIVLKPGDEGRTKLVIKGGRTHVSGGLVGFSPLPLALPARMQLQREDGTCWEAVFDSDGVQAETANLFRAKSAAP